jgi:cyclin-dependent kinase regulatory subunit CKS1
MATTNGSPVQFMDIDLTRRNKKPRPLRDVERSKVEEFVEAIHYSAR